LVGFAQSRMKMYFNIFVLSAVSLISSHIATAFRVQYPQVRFTPYDDLTEYYVSVSSELGYNRTTWNNPGQYDNIEYLGWSEINYEEKQYASDLGFPGNGDGEGNDAWDCWVHHYYSYAWEDLDQKLSLAFEALGWNESTWSGEITEVPDSENKPYRKLTDVEKTAAGVSCWTKSLWDYDELSSFALDSPRAILVGKKEKEKERTCDWASEDLGRCNKTMKNHCCNTCGTCDKFKCVNTDGKFFWKKKNKEKKKSYKECGFLEGISKKKLRKMCKKEGMKETCPENCDLACEVVSV